MERKPRWGCGSCEVNAGWIDTDISWSESGNIGWMMADEVIACK